MGIDENINGNDQIPSLNITDADLDNVAELSIRYIVFAEDDWKVTQHY